MERIEDYLEKYIEKYGALARFSICVVFTLAVIAWVIIALLCLVWIMVIAINAFVVGITYLLWLVPWSIIVAILVGGVIFLFGDDLF